MPDRALMLAVGLALMMLLTVTAGWTQADPTQMLVGRWTGEVQTATATRDRTLIITSVEERYGQLVATAEYGDPGRYAGGARLAPVRGAVDMINGEIVVRFLTGEGGTVALRLSKDGKSLMGSVRATGQVGRSRGGDDSLRLRKVE